MQLRPGVLVVLLTLPSAGRALQQKDSIPREFAPGPDVALLYEVLDQKARGESAKVAELFLLGDELVRPGYERFTEYQLEGIPYEFLFQLPPPEVRKGRTWKVDVTLGAQALGYFRGSDFCPRVTGGYGLVGLRKIKGTSFCVVKGRFDITDGRLQPIPTADARKKAGQTATVKPTLRKIGSLEVELRIQPETGVLEEAFYRYQMKVQARAATELRSGNTVFRTGIQKLDHHRRVVRKEGPEALEPAEIAQKAREAAERGLESLLAAFTDTGTIDIPSNGNGGRQITLAALAARALRACGDEGDKPEIKAALDDLWSRATEDERAIVAVLRSLAALRFPVTLDEPLATLGSEALGPVDKTALPPGHEKAITECLQKVVEAQSKDTGLWGRDLTGPRSAAGGSDAQSIPATTDALTALHYAARLGWEVDPEVWKRVVPTLRETAIPVGPETEIDLEFHPESPYAALAKGGRAEPLGWSWSPLSGRRGDSPSSAETTFQALICLAVIRRELTLEKALDAATEKALTEAQLGGLAWVAAGYTPRSLRMAGYAWNPARSYGGSFEPVLSLYGIEKIGKRDAYVARTALRLHRQNPDGSWNRHRYSGPSFESTVAAILALTRFTTRGW